MSDGDSSDRPTLLVCFACGGNSEIIEQHADGTYRRHLCRWCDSGTMTTQQAATYLAYLKARAAR